MSDYARDDEIAHLKEGREDAQRLEELARKETAEHVKSKIEASYPDRWSRALRETLLEYKDEQFSFEKRDCCQFVNAYYQRMTGKNIAARFPYDSDFAAQRLITKHGGMLGLLTAALGEPADDEPRPGDIVLVEVGEETEAPGIYNGHVSWCLHHEQGLMYFDPVRNRATWHV